LSSFIPHIDDKYEDDDDDDDDDEENNNKENITTDDKRNAKKPRLSTNNSTLESTTPFQMKKQPWMPNHTMAVWKNGLLRKMVTVVVVLDGGLNVDTDVKVKVSEDGHELIIKQKLVDMVANIDTLHNYFRKKDPHAYPVYHPKIIAFQEYMKGMKREVCDNIYNVAKIKLPFQVQSDVEEKHKLGNKDGVRLIYLDLRAVQCEEFISVAEGNLEMVD
jgi:hypothetical protein